MESEACGPLAPGEIHCLDVREGLKRLPDESVDCVVTSPPYWATRDYGVPKSRWPDGSACALGLEPIFQLYIDHLCAIFDEIKRVLKPTGTLWVNLGDTYAGSSGKQARSRIWPASNYPGGRPDASSVDGNPRPFVSPADRIQSVKDRSLCQIPARFAIAMTDHGWILRNDIVWHKPNHMPSSAKNRFTCSWEHLFLFVKQPKYYFDLDSVRVPHKTVGAKLVRPGKHARQRPSPHIHGRRLCPNPSQPQSAHPLGKNPSDLWPIATKASSLGHFAMFPEGLVERPILAGCPARICKRCGTPGPTGRTRRRPEQTAVARRAPDQHRSMRAEAVGSVWSCLCKRGFEPGIVLDPFMGTGTTAVVAMRFGRRFIGFELNPAYVEMARARLASVKQQLGAESEGGSADAA